MTTKLLVVIFILALIGVVYVFSSDWAHQPISPDNRGLDYNPPQGSANSSNPLILPRIKGVRDSNITQSNISGTICHSGYTRTIRPSVAYTQALKAAQIKQLGYADQNIRDYEEDHLIPLELGGSPASPKNLWPEPWYQADKSDPLENALHRRVCSKQMTLHRAQLEILTYKFAEG